MPAKRKIKKTTSIIIFYIVYFVWLTLVTFLTPDPMLLTYFTAGMVLFYFIFLRSSGDWFWFLLGAGVLIVGTIASWESWDIKINLVKLQEMPYWLPLAWGTTIVALKKLYSIVISSYEDE